MCSKGLYLDALKSPVHIEYEVSGVFSRVRKQGGPLFRTRGAIKISNHNPGEREWRLEGIQASWLLKGIKFKMTC